MAELERALRGVNAGMVAFDLALGATAIAAPGKGLRLLGHAAPSEDAAGCSAAAGRSGLRSPPPT